MVCVLKEKKFLKKIQEKDSGKNGKKKKIQIAKKVEKVIPVSVGEEIPVSAREEIKRPLGLRKKQMETNEDKVDKRMKKKKLMSYETKKINKKQQINEEYNEDKKQQNKKYNQSRCCAD